jgi:polar amino acid transport system substrate-binding protein
MIPRFTSPDGGMNLARFLPKPALACAALFFSVLCPAAEPATIRLVTMDYPPYIVKQDGKVQGPVVSVVKEAFHRLGYHVSIELLPWSRSLDMVSQGTADGLFTIKKTPEREATLLYVAEPVLTQEYVLFVHKDSAFRFDGNLASLANVKLGVTANNSYGPRFDEALRQGQFRHLQTAYDHEHLFRMLVAGRIEVAIGSKVVGQAFIHAIHADDQVVVADPAVMTAYSYLVFTRQRDFTELARVFEQTLVAMRRDGTLAKLLGENTRLGTSNH